MVSFQSLQTPEAKIAKYHTYSLSGELKADVPLCFIIVSFKKSSLWLACTKPLHSFVVKIFQGSPTVLLSVRESS